MSKSSRRCCKIAVCPLKIVFDVFLVCICFVVLLAFHFLRKKQKLPTFPKILRFGSSLLGFFRVFLKYLCFTYLQKILHKNSNLESHLYMLVFHFQAAFPQPWKCGSRFCCLIPDVAVNIADSRAVLPSELGLSLLNNLSLESWQIIIISN